MWRLRDNAHIHGWHVASYACGLRRAPALDELQAAHAIRILRWLETYAELEQREAPQRERSCHQAAVRSSRAGAGRAKPTTVADGSTRSARSGAWASRQSWHRSEAPTVSDGAMRPPQARQVAFPEVMPPS
jgi:hypothetical protein